MAKHGVHQTLINTWKRQALEGMSGVFSNGAEAAAAAADREAELDRLHAKIGQLVVERDFLRKGEPSKAPSVRARWRADDEPRPEARDDRARASAAVDRAAVSARLDQPVGLTHGPARGESPLNLALMRLTCEQFLETPWYGSRQMARHLRRQGHIVGRKRVRRLMAKMGLRAV